MIFNSGSLNRRNFVIGSIGAASIATSVSAETPESTPVESGSQYLITSMTLDGNPDMLIGIESFDADLNRLSQMEVADGVVQVQQTGRSGVVHLMTMFGALMVDLNAGEVSPINWDIADPGYVFPAPPDDGTNNSDVYSLAQTLEHDKVLLVDLQTLDGFDITEYIANESTDLIAMVPDIPLAGSIGGIWTGDNVYRFDFDDFASADSLVGDDPEWYSTTLQLSTDGKWGIYTTYDPEGQGKEAHCYIQDLETGSYTKIIDGHAWSTGFFIPGDPEHFIALGPDTGLEYRSVASPAEAGNVIAEVEQQGGKFYWLNDGKVLLYGHRTDNDAPRNWIRVNMETLDVTELPDLEGQLPQWPKLARTAPKHLIFGSESFENASQSLYGFDVESCEVWLAAEDVYLENLTGVTGSADGMWYTASTPNRGQNIGVWLFNMSTKDVHKLEEGDGRYAEYGAVSPDGQTLAVTYLEQPAGIRYTATASTESPEEMTKLTDSLVMGWSL